MAGSLKIKHFKSHPIKSNLNNKIFNVYTNKTMNEVNMIFIYLPNIVRTLIAKGYFIDMCAVYAVRVKFFNSSFLSKNCFFLPDFISWHKLIIQVVDAAVVVVLPSPDCSSFKCSSLMTLADDVFETQLFFYLFFDCE